MKKSTSEPSDEHITSAKLLPDESNRKDIELMLLHAYEFCISEQRGELETDET